MNILTIDQLRNRKYPASELKIEEKVKDEPDFASYIASYYSDGLKIYGYLVVPKVVIPTKVGIQSLHGSRVEHGMTVVIFCHGYVEPKDYLPERQYARHCEDLASKGFVVFKPDYRGHGNSQGEVETIFESGYTVDVLNAMESLFMDSHRNLPRTFIRGGNDKDEGIQIGIMGHSLGGNIALKVMEVNSNIKAGVIWAGAVAGYDEILSRWGKNNSLRPVAEELIEKYGEPKENPEFWKSISPINFLEYINASILIQHGEKDESISISQAIDLEKALKLAGKHDKLVLYKNGTHNFEAEIYDQAIQKAVEFFQLHLSFLRAGIHTNKFRGSPLSRG